MFHVFIVSVALTKVQRTSYIHVMQDFLYYLSAAGCSHCFNMFIICKLLAILQPQHHYHHHLLEVSFLIFTYDKETLWNVMKIYGVTLRNYDILQRRLRVKSELSGSERGMCCVTMVV